MFQLDQDLAELIFAYCRNRLALDPVPLDAGGTHDETVLAAALAGLIGLEGRDPETVMELFQEHLAPAVISVDSPRFLSFIPAAPTKASLLFDMVVSCSSLQGTSWLEAAGAVAAENQALRVLADLAGLPIGAGGCFVSGGTAANLSGLLVARDVARLRGHHIDRPMIAVGEESHSSVGRALHVIGVEPLMVATRDHQLSGPALAHALAAHPRRDDVIGLVATAGTTNAGIVDDLAGLAEVAALHRLWFHVDAAYGGAALFAPDQRPRFAGIERADSLVIDPHKWLFAPFDCAALLYREPSIAKAVHTQDAAYLEPLHHLDSWNPSDYALHLTRRARGLPLWFSLAVHGTDAYRRAVEGALAAAQEAARMIDAASHLELVRPPGLSIVLFRRRGWRGDDYLAWSAKLLADQVGFVTPTTWEGETVARLAFLHPETTPAITAEILATLA